MPQSGCAGRFNILDSMRHSKPWARSKFISGWSKMLMEWQNGRILSSIQRSPGLSQVTVKQRLIPTSEDWLWLVLFSYPSKLQAGRGYTKCTLRLCKPSSDCGTARWSGKVTKAPSVNLWKMTTGEVPQNGIKWREGKDVKELLIFMRDSQWRDLRRLHAARQLVDTADGCLDKIHTVLRWQNTFQINGNNSYCDWTNKGIVMRWGTETKKGLIRKDCARRFNQSTNVLHFIPLVWSSHIVLKWTTWPELSKRQHYASLQIILLDQV